MAGGKDGAPTNSLRRRPARVVWLLAVGALVALVVAVLVAVLL